MTPDRVVATTFNEKSECRSTVLGPFDGLDNAVESKHGLTFVKSQTRRGPSSIRRLGRQLIGAPVPGNHKSRFGVFFSACRCGCVHCPFFLAKINQGAVKIGHQGQDKTILQSCAFLC